MGVFFKRLMMAGATLLAGYAIKKMIGSMQKQMEAARDRADEQLNQQASGDSKQFKVLKQDPATGVYYAED